MENSKAEFDTLTALPTFWTSQNSCQRRISTVKHPSPRANN